MKTRTYPLLILLVCLCASCAPWFPPLSPKQTEPPVVGAPAVEHPTTTLPQSPLGGESMDETEKANIGREGQTGQQYTSPSAPQEYSVGQDLFPPAPMAGLVPFPQPTALASAPFAPHPPIPAPANSAPADNYFQNYGINPFMDAREDHLSTFGLDVDTASYSVARNYINSGFLPPADAIRVEEFINSFDMGYPAPPGVAFGIYADGATSPYWDGTHLIRIGIQGYQVPEARRKPANLVFVIDVSGSMAQDNRLELVKRSLRLLVDRLHPDDRVGIVVYGSQARILLDPVNGSDKGVILEAIQALQPEGSTNAEAGLIVGYDMAMRIYRNGSINRVILCSDGVANTGATDPNVILSRIHGYVSEGVTLTTVGFGMGNFNDVLMEQMADNGDGNYFYVDTIDEARKVFVENLVSNLQVIARDAKVQVDFNPQTVARYRLLGYENRAIADQDFRNDSVDAGEIGAGHGVTALYAVQLYPRAQGRLATVQLRWQDPDDYKVLEINGNVNTWDLASTFEKADPHFQLAVIVSQFAEILRNSPWSAGTTLHTIRNQAALLSERLPRDPDVLEFYHLVDRALQLQQYIYE